MSCKFTKKQLAVFADAVKSEPLGRNDWQVKIMEDWVPRRLVLKIGVQSFFMDIQDSPSEPGRMEWYRAQLTNAMKNAVAQVKT